jgi:hypothetical protein
MSDGKEDDSNEKYRVRGSQGKYLKGVYCKVTPRDLGSIETEHYYKSFLSPCGR